MQDIIRIIIEKAASLSEAREFMAFCGIVPGQRPVVALGRPPSAKKMTAKPVGRPLGSKDHSSHRRIGVKKSRWTVADDRRIVSMRADGIPPRAIAVSLVPKRTPQAISTRLWKLGRRETPMVVVSTAGGGYVNGHAHAHA